MALYTFLKLWGFVNFSYSKQFSGDLLRGFLRGTTGKDSVCQCQRCKRWGLILVSGRSPGVGNGNPLQYSCLENPTDGGAWQTTVHGATKNWTHLNTHTHTLYSYFEIPISGLYTALLLQMTP